MVDVNMEWEDVEKKLEEQDFIDEKSKVFSNQQAEKAKEAAASEPSATGNQSTPDQPNEIVGIARMGADTWNEIAVSKGYEPVTDAQKDFLQKHTNRLEEKYLRDRINILPEVESALVHVVVYLPKYLRKHAQKKEVSK